jgi:uncharacterized membrane protein YhhN
VKKAARWIFVAVSLAQLVSVTWSYPLLHTISKPLILPSLITYFLISASERNSYFISALIFCWAGDVLLMVPSELFFILGLVAFLTGHVCYIISYRALRYPKGESLMNTQKIRYSLPIILAGTGLVSVLYPHLAELKIPVMVYALVLTVMVMQALFRYGFTSKESFVWVFAGALLFMVSDSLLAINKFMQPVPYASLVIMSTYIVAQFLIVEGAIRHSRL